MKKKRVLATLTALYCATLLSFAPVYGDEIAEEEGDAVLQRVTAVADDLEAKAHPHNLPKHVEYPPLVKHLLVKSGIYTSLYNTLAPQVENLTLIYSRITDQTTYATFYNACVAVANSVTPSGRLVFAESDGTVVVDTGLGTNSYANWQAKTVNENHNTRASFMLANIYPAGIAVETKFSTSVGTNQLYVAIRGQTRDSHAKHPAKTFLNGNAKGVFRISVNQDGPPAA